MDQNEKQIFVKDFMTKKVFTVRPDMPVTEAARIITEHNFNGLPVADEKNKLIGIITEYDLLTKTSDLNNSFLENILRDIYELKGEKKSSSIVAEKKFISELIVSDVMNPKPITLMENATFEEVVSLFKDHHKANPIPVINEQNEIVGIVSRFDILRPLNILSFSKNKN